MNQQPPDRTSAYKSWLERAVRAKNSVQICIAEQEKLRRQMHQQTLEFWKRYHSDPTETTVVRDTRIRLTGVQQLREEAERMLMEANEALKQIELERSLSNIENNLSKNKSASSMSGSISSESEGRLGKTEKDSLVSESSTDKTEHAVLRIANSMPVLRPTRHEFEQVGMLVDERGFFDSIVPDIEQARFSIEILCPFVKEQFSYSLKRLGAFCARGGTVIFYTRPNERSEFLEAAKRQGITIIFREKMHEKVIIIDDRIVWEGSLNMFAHYESSDCMRRLVGTRFAQEHRNLHKLPEIIDIAANYSDA